MESSQNTGLVKSTMTYGAILGLTVVAYSFILFITNVMPVGLLLSTLFFLISIGVYFTGIFIFTKKIRNNLLGGYITYSQGIMIGMLISLFAAFLTSFYTYIQNVFMDPDYINRLADAQKNWISNFMSRNNIPEDKIEETISKIDETVKDYSPVKSLFQGVVGGTFVGTLISLITAAILKKKPNPFEQSFDKQ